MSARIEGRPPLVVALLKADAYPESVDQIGLTETHASYLFFVGDFVFKVKKPVDYGFMNFTTLEKRRYYCEREVALNSRMSPEVYLGVVTINEQHGVIHVEGPGDTIEYAVKMRKLPQDRALNELLRQNMVTAHDIRQMAAKFAEFHKDADAGPEVSALGGLDVVRQNVEENFQQTEERIGTCLSRHQFDDIAAYSRAFLDVRARVFEGRVRDGRIRDCHGDLHSANIFFDDGIHVIDCIEFNDRFRCLDVAEDIAFLAMDLDFFGRPDLSAEFVDAYVEESGDPGVLELLDFFKCYRAYVRAKVSSFRLDDESMPQDEREAILQEVQTYFKLAHTYTAKAMPAPAMYMTAGLMGTGKSHIGEELAKRWGMAYISSDQTRKELAGIDTAEHRYEAYEQGIYSADFTRRTYDAMCQQARLHLSKGKSVLLDATFRRAEERKAAIDAASEAGVNSYIIECVASDDEIRRRLEQRLASGEATASDGRWELFQQQKADWEPVREVPQASHITLDTTGPAQENIRTLLQEIFRRALAQLS